MKFIGQLIQPTPVATWFWTNFGQECFVTNFKGRDVKILEKDIYLVTKRNFGWGIHDAIYFVAFI